MSRVHTPRHAFPLLHELARPGTASARPLRELAFHPTGESLWAITHNELLAWELPSGRLIGAACGPPLHGLALREEVATALGEEALLRWDSRSFKSLVATTFRSRLVEPRGFSPDTRRVLFGRRALEVYAVGAKGKGSWKLPVGVAEGSAPALSPGGRFAAAFTADGRLVALDVVRAKPLWAHALTAEAVVRVCFVGDDALLVAHAGGALSRYALASGERVWTRAGPVKYPLSLTASDDGARAAVRGSDWLLVFDAATGRNLRSLPEHGGEGPVALSHDGRQVAVTRGACGVRVMEVATKREVADGGLLGGAVESLLWSTDGRTLVSTVDEDPTVRVWDVPRGEASHAFELDASFHDSAALSPDGRRFACASEHGDVRVWEVASGVELAALRGALFASVLDWLPDASALVVSGEANGRATVVCWSPDTQRVRWRYEHEGPLYFGELRRAICCDPRGAVVWLLLPSERVALRADTGAVHTRRESDASLSCIPQTTGAYPRRWSLTTTAALKEEAVASWLSAWRTLAAEREAGWHPLVRSRLVSADAAQRLCATAFDEGAALWNLATAESLGAISVQREGDRVSAVALSPDGTKLAVGTMRGALRVYRVGARAIEDDAATRRGAR